MATYGTFVDGVSLKAAEANDFFKWTTFTGVVKQSVTLSASTNTCRYAQVNKLIHVSFYFVISSTGTTGNRVEVNLPVTAASSSIRTVGFGTIRDQSALTTYNVVPVLNSTTTVAFLSTSATSLTNYFGVTGGPTVTLASSDTVRCSIVYEAA
jgi:hypothetical protein